MGKVLLRVLGIYILEQHVQTTCRDAFVCSGALWRVGTNMAPSPIKIPVQGSPISSAVKFLARNVQSSGKAREESELLKSIQVALRGSAPSIHSTIFASEEDPWIEEEVTWDAYTVIVSSGGIMHKKWNFEEEGQCVQWACTGWLEQTASGASQASSSSAAHYTSTSDPPPAPIPDSQRPTFGPFSSAHKDSRQRKEKVARHRAVFVFLRSIGRIFLKNGLDYTFSLPFIVRKAWPIYPHGVMIQRVLDSTEMEESETTGDDVLPTIFSITSPFSEAAAVGLTSGIIGGFNSIPPSLKDEEENSTKPLKSIPPTETVIWASERMPKINDDVLVTIDTYKHELSIWRYVYIKPKDTPMPLSHNKPQNTGRRRSHKPQPSGVRDPSGRNRVPPLSPKLDEGQSTLVFPELPPLAALPGMPPELSNPTTMADLVAGTSSLPPLPAPHKGRRNSLTRNDLSMTMDRMMLGGRMDVDPHLTPIDHGRMNAAFWMEKLYSQNISEVT